MDRWYGFEDFGLGYLGCHVMHKFIRFGDSVPASNTSEAGEHLEIFYRIDS